MMATSTGSRNPGGSRSASGGEPPRTAAREKRNRRPLVRRREQSTETAQPTRPKTMRIATSQQRRRLALRQKFELRQVRNPPPVNHHRANRPQPNRQRPGLQRLSLQRPNRQRPNLRSQSELRPRCARCLNLRHQSLAMHMFGNAPIARSSIMHPSIRVAAEGRPAADRREADQPEAGDRGDRHAQAAERRALHTVAVVDSNRRETMECSPLSTHRRHQTSSSPHVVGARRSDPHGTARHSAPPQRVAAGAGAGNSIRVPSSNSPTKRPSRWRS